jgi:hypothetical protein
VHKYLPQNAPTGLKQEVAAISYNFFMKARIFNTGTVFFCVLTMLFTGGCTCLSPDPLHGNLKVFPGTPDEGQGQPPAASTQPQLSSPAQPASPVERQVTVTASNSVFSIGLPPGYTEEREIKASKPIDVWFEYLTNDMSLEVNGTAVPIPERRTTAKTGYFTGVTQLKYVMKNLSAQALSYNLHMLPTNAADKVPVVTREKWTAP